MNNLCLGFTYDIPPLQWFAKQKERKRLPLPSIGLIGGFQGYWGLLELIAQLIDIMMEVLASTIAWPSAKVGPPQCPHGSFHIYMQLIELPEWMFCKWVGHSNNVTSCMAY
jgi:hypothetical protein